MRRTLASLIPTAAAMVRVDQWVALAGFSWVVLRMTSRFVAAEMRGVRPGRGASFSVDTVLAVPHSVIKERVEEHRRQAANNPNRPGPKPKRKIEPSASDP